MKQIRLTPIVVLVAWIVACSLAAQESRAQVSFTEYAGPSMPLFEGGYVLVDITSGPDGNLWFTENYAFGAPTQIGRVTTSGAMTLFTIPSGDSEGDIAAGPDGNLWFTEYRTNKIGRVTPGGVFTEFTIPTGGTFPGGITAGTDGNLWFTETQVRQIGRITPAGVITEFSVPGGSPAVITAGADGNMWFTENFANRVGKITPAGVITEFPLPTSGSYPIGITAGADGNMWFTEDSANQIGRITPSGAIAEFPVPSSNAQPVRISAGPDGNLWFTEDAGNHLGRITPAGVVTEYPAPTAGRMSGITVGPDNKLWFLEATANKLVKVTGLDTTPPTTLGSLSGAAGSNGWYTGPVTVTLTAADPDGASDVAHTYYTVDGGATQVYSGPFTVTGDAIHTVAYWSVDRAGNEEKTHPSTLISIDSAVPTVTAAANPLMLWPPNGKTVSVTVTGRITDVGSGVDPGTVRFSVVDDYGLVQPSGSITMQPDGSYAFTIQLEARRNGGDKAGRHYAITVTARDNAGNAGSAQTVVVVPHDQGH